MSVRKIQSSLLVADADPLVCEHRVEDMHVLPGVSMLDAVYKTLAAAGCVAESVVLRNILFHEPVVTHEEMDRKLNVCVEKDEAGGKVTVSSLPWKGDKALAGDATVHMSCNLAPLAALSLPALPAVSLDGGDDLDRCYGVTRHVGIYHDGFMKCAGRVRRLPSGDTVAHLSLNARAAARSGDFLFHPVLLDCSTIVPWYGLSERLADTSLFIPFAIDEFCGRALTGKREVLIKVERSEQDPEAREILRHSFQIYDMQGQALAAFRNFAVKRVRSLENVRRLLNSGLSARSARVTSMSSASREAGAVAAHGAQADPLSAHIGALIERCGKVKWNPADTQKPFFDLGVDSLALLEMSEALEKDLSVELYPTLLFEHSSVGALSAYLRENFPAQTAALAPRGGNAAAAAVVRQDACGATATTDAVHRPGVLIPRWQAIARPAMGAEQAGPVMVLKAGHDSLPEGLRKRLGPRLALETRNTQEIRAALAADSSCDTVWLADAEHESAYALARELIQAGHLQRGLKLCAFTVGAYSVLGEPPQVDAGHGAWGLLQSLAREYPRTRVCLVDLDVAAVAELSREGTAPWIACLLRMDVPPRRLLALREGQFYERRLFRVQAGAALDPVLRDGGAYLILGGAGGVGMTFLRHLRRRYGARVAVMGRRPEESLREVLAAEGEYGRDVLYCQGSVESAADIARAIQAARDRFGKLHGVVHSAMVLEDKKLAEMDEGTYRRVLRPKVEGVRALAEATCGLELDFLLFFSSVQSFVGNVSQANYAAASTYLDGYAAALRAARPYPVMVINWGFWSEVGAVATAVYRQLLARLGMHGLRETEALAALEQVLAERWEQAVVVDAEGDLLRELGFSDDWMLERPEGGVVSAHPVLVSVPERELEANRCVFTDTNQAMALLAVAARGRVAAVLRELDAADVDAAVAAGRLAREHRALAQALQRLLASHPAEPMPATAYNERAAGLARAHPVLNDFLPLLQACLEAFPDILSGRLPAAEVVFPAGSVGRVQAVYGRNPISLFYNRIVARAVVALAARQSGKPLRILEVGAGTGSTTEEVLLALRAEGLACEYFYSDLWDKLVVDARARLGTGYPELQFRLLDIGSDPRAQGVDERFDAVIATNVLHAARNLRSALRHAKLLLRRGGALVLNESVQPQEYSTYTFGLLPGWWTITDAELRLPDAPLAERSTWLRLLREEGFQQVNTLVPSDIEPAFAAQEVFIGFSNGENFLPRRALRPVQSPPPSELPAALLGRLQPESLATLGGAHLPPLRRLRLFRDTKRNLWLFLDNPPANTFTEELLGELCTLLELLQSRPRETLGGRILYLSHYGTYFSLGGDRNQIVELLAAGRRDAVRSFADKARRVLAALATLDALVVAVVNDTAQGAGLETLFATDLQLVRDGIKLGLPEIKSGLLPGMGGLSHLRTQVGMARAKRLVLTGDLIEAREALEMGLISHVVGDPFAAALELGDKAVHMDTVVHTKRLLGREFAGQLTADIDVWLDYVQDHQEWIDVPRIVDSKAVLDVQTKQRSASLLGGDSP